MRKRSVLVSGHPTSVSLEAEFWEALGRIARRRILLRLCPGAGAVDLLLRRATAWGQDGPISPTRPIEASATTLNATATLRPAFSYECR